MIGGSNGCCQCSARKSVPKPAFARSYGAASTGTLRQKRSTWLFGLPHAATAVMPTDETPIQHLLTLPPRMAAGMPALCSDLEMHNIERAGHWVQQEFPDAVNQTIVDWLKRRFKK